MVDDEIIRLRELLREVYEYLIEEEEKAGWPGTEPAWSLRQKLVKELGDL